MCAAHGRLRGPPLGRVRRRGPGGAARGTPSPLLAADGSRPREMNGAQTSGEGAVEGEGDELTAACTGRAEGIMYNRSMALRVGAEKLTRLSPKFTTSLIRVSGREAVLGI